MSSRANKPARAEGARGVRLGTVFLTAAVACSIIPAGGRSARSPATAAATRPSAPKWPAAPPGARSIEAGWFAPPPPRKAKAPDLPQEITRAFVIPIHGPIDDTTYEGIKRKVVRWGKVAQIIILDLDTPGGSGEAMDNIVRLIIEDLQDVYTVAYVHPQAMSAGAIISLACDEIVFSPTGRLGAAMPIMIGPGGIVPIPEKERGKFESASRSQVRMLAKRTGYNVLMCEAMITITMELWLIRNPDTMELRIADAKEWRGKVINAPATTQPVHLAGKTTPSRWVYVETIDDPKEVVTLTADEAIRWGFTRHVFASPEQLYQHYNINSAPQVLEDTWSEHLVSFLSSAPVVALLIFVGMLCLYIEINTPGFGVAGTIAIACFAILLGSRFLVGLATWWEIGLFVVGLILLAIEVFVTPGFGVLGISGIVCCVVGLLAMLVRNAPTELPLPSTDLDWSIFKTGLVGMMIGLFGALIAAGLVAKYLPRIPVANRLILAAPEPTEGPATESAAIRSIEIGQIGTVERPCRPVGQVRIGEALIDAIADGAFLAAGAKVRVIRNEGNRLVISAAEEDDDGAA